MEETFFDKRVKNDIRTYDNIQKFARCQENDYITICLIDYFCFKKY